MSSAQYEAIETNDPPEVVEDRGGTTLAGGREGLANGAVELILQEEEDDADVLTDIPVDLEVRPPTKTKKRNATQLAAATHTSCRGVDNIECNARERDTEEGSRERGRGLRGGKTPFLSLTA